MGSIDSKHDHFKDRTWLTSQDMPSYASDINYELQQRSLDLMSRAKTILSDVLEVTERRYDCIAFT